MRPAPPFGRLLAGLLVGCALALSAPAFQAHSGHEMLLQQDFQSSPPKLQGLVDSWIKWLKHGTYERSGGQPFAAPLPPGLPANVVSIYMDIDSGAYSGPTPGCTTLWREIYIWLRFSDGSHFTWWRIWQLKSCGPGSTETFESVLSCAGVEDPLTGAFTGWVRSYANETLNESRKTSLRGSAGATIALAPYAALPRPLVGNGHDPVDITLGPGGVLDLRGIDTAAGPLFSTDGPVLLRCDQILMDPGVQIADLFQPPPIVLPGALVHEIGLVGPTAVLLPTAAPSFMPLRLANLGNAAATVSVSWSDSLGWSFGGPQILSADPLAILELQLPVAAPPASMPGDLSLLQAQASASPAAPSSVSTSLARIPAPPQPSMYCSGKTNSVGCVPRISFEGHATLSGNDDLVVGLSEVIAGQHGALFLGLAPASAPFQGGTLCVAPPVQRFPAAIAGPSGAGGPCEGMQSLHFTQEQMATMGLQGGMVAYAQWWMRDPGDPFGTGLSDALQLPVGP